MKILTSMGIDFKYQYKLPTLHRRRYDFYFVYKGKYYIIEYDGGQHFFYVAYFKISLEQNQRNDIFKTYKALSSNINVIRIDYTIKFDKIENEIKEALEYTEEIFIYSSTPELYEWLVKGTKELYYKEEEMKEEINILEREEIEELETNGEVIV